MSMVVMIPVYCFRYCVVIMLPPYVEGWSRHLLHMTKTATLAADIFWKSSRVRKKSSKHFVLNRVRAGQCNRKCLLVPARPRTFYSLGKRRLRFYKISFPSQSCKLVSLFVSFWIPECPGTQIRCSTYCNRESVILNRTHLYCLHKTCNIQFIYPIYVRPSTIYNQK